MLDKTQKPLFRKWKQKKHLKKNYLFFQKMSQSAENPKESSMIAKRFVSSKVQNEGASLKANWKKVA